MTSRTRTALVVSGILLGFGILLATSFIAWGALKHGRDDACIAQTKVPDDAVTLGESGPVLTTTDSAIPLGVWCSYETASGREDRQFADLGTLPLVLGLGLVVGSIVLAVRRPAVSVTTR